MLIEKIFFKAISIRYKNKDYFRKKLQILALVACLCSALITYSNFDYLRLQSIQITKVAVRDFESGFLINTSAKVTVFLSTESVVDKLEVILLFKDGSNQARQMSKSVNIVPDPLIFSNKADFDLPVSIRSIAEIKVKLVLNAYEKIITPEIQKGT